MQPIVTAGPHPLEALWNRAWVVSVGSMGAALAAVLALAPGVEGDRVARFVFSLLFIEWVAAGTLVVIFLARDWAARLDPPRLATFAVLILLANTWLFGTVTWSLLQMLATNAESWVEFMARLTSIALCMSLPALAAFRNYWKVHRLSLEAQRAQVAALQARVRPHFLFNTLNTGAALVHAHPEQAERLLLDLSDLFRAALKGDRIVTLAEELALVRRYLEIESLRFGDRLAVDWAVDAEACDIAVPALCVQAIVENAIHHGIERLPSGGVIRVHVSDTAAETRVDVRNPLPAAGAGPARQGHQVGLSATRASIEAFTRGRGHVDTRIEGDTFVCTLAFPRDAAVSR